MGLLNFVTVVHDQRQIVFSKEETYMRAENPVERIFLDMTGPFP